MAKLKISPIKEKPLRHPGQSLDEQLDRILSEDVFLFLVCWTAFIFMAAYEWYRKLAATPPQPIIMTFFAVLATPYFIVRIYQAQKKYKALKLGRDGERIVGQLLEQLREKEDRVLHDVIGNGFNIDHVIISSHGIFTIETKTLNKPSKEAHVKYDGVKLLVDGHEQNQYLIQAKAEATWLNTLLKESTGKFFQVRPVIVFPDWYIESIGSEAHRDLWVLNPKALPAFISKEKIILPQEDVQLATYHLSRYIKTL